MPVQLPPDLMVSVSGVRGRVGHPLTPELVSAMSAAFGGFLRSQGETGPVLVGRDSRTSGPMFVRAVTAGLQSVGSSVVDLGVVSTPTLMLAVREHSQAAGGVGVTASHNPAEWNALKLAGGDGTFLDGERSRAFREFLTTVDPKRASWDALGGWAADDAAVDRHLERILCLPHLDLEALRARKFHVAVDCVHGAGGEIITRLLEALGCRLSGMGMEPDGLFPRDPEPTAANLAPLGSWVRESGAELGMAIDPDGDRLSLVDGAGKPLGEDYTLALAADTVLRRTPGPVVTNLSTSQLLEDVAEAHDCLLIRTPVGEINVARGLQREGGAVGGEGNGGVILPALHLTRDASVGVALILQHLLDTGGSLAAAAGRWPRYTISKEKLDFPRDRLPMAYDALVAGNPQAGVDTSDGLRLAWRASSRWLHLRPSGTEPVVRVIAEAPSSEAVDALVEDCRVVLEQVRG